MNVTKFLTTSAAALSIVGAGLVYAQVTTPTTPPAAPQQDAQQAPTTPPSTGATTTPSQDTMQRSDTMSPDARADRN